MSKLINDQIKKTEILISGLRNNIEVVKSWGISETLINELGVEKNELAEANKELERLKAEVKEKSRAANKKMANIQKKFMELKRKVKGNTDIIRYGQFGIMDRR